MNQDKKKVDRIKILSENRYEWAVTDLAIQLVGAINVALYTTLPASQCEFIVKNSGSKLFFVSTGIQLKKAVAIFRYCPDLKSVIAFDEPKVKKDMEHDFVSFFDSICSLVSGSNPKYEGAIQESIDRIMP